MQTFNNFKSSKNKKEADQKHFFEKMDFNFQKENRSLTITRLMIEAWQMNRMCFEYGPESEMNQKMQQIIKDHAIIEWGKSTVAIFNEDSLLVRILNSDGREKEFKVC